MLTKSLLIALGAAAVAQAAVLDPAVFKRENPPGYPCNRNNCLRSMVKQEVPTRLAEAIADCTSYFWATETPPTVTETNTITDSTTATFSDPTITTTVVYDPPQDLGRRDVVLPTYAQGPCENDFSRWSSVCSCLGVTSSTSTVATPYTTVDTHVTETSTSTVAGATVTPLVGYIRRFSPNAVPPSNNQRAGVDSASRLFYFNQGDPNPVPNFVFDSSNGYLWSGNKVAKKLTGSNAINFVAPAAAGTPYVCSVAADRQIFCTLDGATQYWSLQNHPDDTLKRLITLLPTLPTQSWQQLAFKLWA